MTIGVFSNPWWRSATQAAAIDTCEIGVTFPNAHQADLAARLQAGNACAETMRAAKPTFLLDNSGAGLQFVPGQGTNAVQPLHESAGLPLYSHFIDPLTTAFQGIGWATAWQCLQSKTWIKLIWDRAHAAELNQFGVPGISHVPMAAPDRDYCTDPLPERPPQPIVSFVGNQNTSYFSSGAQLPTNQLLTGTLATAVHGDLPSVQFYNVYYDLYKLAEPPMPDDDLQTQVQKTMAYFNAKLFYHAHLCIRNRDRFVFFLRKTLGDSFALIGTRWDTTYGLACRPPLSTDAYFQHFRDVAINVNLVNGNAETGLNMRHFEITAAGGFMLCYAQPELADHFIVGKECEVFHNEGELIDKCRYYLEHPKERIEIALAGQRRTLFTHLYSHRLATIIRLAQAQGVMPHPVKFDKGHWHDVVKAAVPTARVVLDCGANVGHTTKALRALYPDAKIFAFEPVHQVFTHLVERCRSIGATAVKKAVADHDGSTTINITASHECHSLLRFQPGNPCSPWTREVGTETVEVCTLDQWCQDNGVEPSHIDVIKLDVQGAELLALRGAKRILGTVRAVYLEVSFIPLYEGAPLLDEIDAFMSAQGFARQALYPSDQPQHWGDAVYIKAEESNHGAATVAHRDYQPA